MAEMALLMGDWGEKRKRKKKVFFEKKNQKTFYLLRTAPEFARVSPVPHRVVSKIFFGSFFQKRTRLLARFNV